MNVLQTIFLAASAVALLLAIVLASRGRWFLATWCAAGGAFGLFLTHQVLS